MGPDAALRTQVPGYAGRPTTKAPNWHGLVAMDLVFNNLSTGMFLAAALGELVMPASVRPLASIAYPVALVFLIADLICLVLDLGDRTRFHHMLRVWKPSSPMSLGTWLLAAYAIPVTVLSALSLFGGGREPESLRRVVLVIGIVLAVGAAVYKGVLFSTTAQRGWGDARWLGGYLINSAVVLGAAELLLLATMRGEPLAAVPLRAALRWLLLLNLVALALLVSDLRGALADARGTRVLAVLGVVSVVGGILLPLWLLGSARPAALGASLLLILIGEAVVRQEMVSLPHSLGKARPGG
jgi:Ni/Fe-hydrogenase subunit HybB-like protein